MNRLTRRFVLIAVAIVTTLTIGTVGFTLIDGYPPFDAFYMTLTTMTTVGYGESIRSPTPAASSIPSSSSSASPPSSSPSAP